MEWEIINDNILLLITQTFMPLEKIIAKYYAIKLTLSSSSSSSILW